MNRHKERIMQIVFLIAALSSIIAVLLICIFLFANGLPSITKIGWSEFLLGRDWSPANIPPSFGIFPMIIGSIYVTALAILFGCPIGIFTAVFMARFSPKIIYKLLKPAISLMAGIPSIIYGFFGMVTLVPLIRVYFGGNGNSILTASLLLAIMILPTVITISESALRAVPDNYYEGALALGASHERSVFYVVLPAAKSGVLAAVVLGVGRAIGETMAVIMVAGNQAQIPGGILQGVRTLTANIVLEMGYAAELHREALIATGMVLFVFILIINMSFSLLQRRKKI